ncbi:MAG: methionyl-tRNA formyltransferase [Kiritimatiellae bacterium]|nr:methionyl-tRNA formyltransferase [Kiritimatiellia bacterium]
MRVVFMGSAELSCWCLRALVADPRVEVVAAVTQPDRPRGRKLHLAPCVARKEAERAGIPVLTPANVNAPDSIAAIATLQPDVIVTAAYGQILKPALLELPPIGCMNVHFSLLPCYRGAAPIQWAIVNGDTETGVTIMFMDEGMDTGDIIEQKIVPITPDDTAGTLHDKLAVAGGELLPGVLHRIVAGQIVRTPQDGRQATLARKLRKSDGRIDWTLSSNALYNRIRGFNPWPGCFTTASGQKKGKTLRVFSVSMVNDVQGAPGEIAAVTHEGPVVATGEGGLCLLEVQPEGGRRMSGEAYLCGHAMQVGDQFE